MCAHDHLHVCVTPGRWCLWMILRVYLPMGLFVCLLINMFPGYGAGHTALRTDASCGPTNPLP